MTSVQNRIGYANTLIKISNERDRGRRRRLCMGDVINVSEPNTPDNVKRTSVTMIIEGVSIIKLYNSKT